MITKKEIENLNSTEEIEKFIQQYENKKKEEYFKKVCGGF